MVEHVEDRALVGHALAADDLDASKEDAQEEAAQGRQQGAHGQLSVLARGSGVVQRAMLREIMLRSLAPALLVGLLACDGGTTTPDDPGDDALGDGQLTGKGPGGAGGLLDDEQDPAVVEAEALLAEGKAEAALQRIDQALADNPAQGRFHFVRGNALTYLDRDDEAQRAYEKAIELAPDDPLAHAALGNLLAFAPDANDTDKRAAIAQYQQALKLDPELAVAHQGLGTVLLDMRDSQRAIEALDNAKRLAPSVEVTDMPHAERFGVRLLDRALL